MPIDFFINWPRLRTTFYTPRTGLEYKYTHKEDNNSLGVLFFLVGVSKLLDRYLISKNQGQIYRGIYLLWFWRGYGSFESVIYGLAGWFYFKALSHHLVGFWRKNTVKYFVFCSVTDRRGYAPSQNARLSCIFLVKSLKMNFS